MARGQINFDIDEKLKKDFTIILVKENRTKTEVLNDFIRKYVADRTKEVVS